MKMFVDAPTIYFYPGHVDFRKSINGLALIVEPEGTYSPFDDALFVFCNRDKVKARYWDKTGFCLWYKRLQKDFFRWPKEGQQAVQLTEGSESLIERFSVGRISIDVLCKKNAICTVANASGAAPAAG